MPKLLHLGINNPPVCHSESARLRAAETRNLFNTRDFSFLWGALWAMTNDGYDRRLIGSNMGSNAFRIDMPPFVDFYLNGKLNLDALISKRVPLEMVNEAYAEMLTGTVARSVITFDY